MNKQQLTLTEMMQQITEVVGPPIWHYKLVDYDNSIRVTLEWNNRRNFRDFQIPRSSADKERGKIIARIELLNHMTGYIWMDLFGRRDDE